MDTSETVFGGSSDVLVVRIRILVARRVMVACRVMVYRGTMILFRWNYGLDPALGGRRGMFSCYCYYDYPVRIIQMICVHSYLAFYILLRC